MLNQIGILLLEISDMEVSVALMVLGTLPGLLGEIEGIDMPGGIFGLSYPLRAFGYYK